MIEGAVNSKGGHEPMMQLATAVVVVVVVATGLWLYFALMLAL